MSYLKKPSLFMWLSFRNCHEARSDQYSLLFASSLFSRSARVIPLEVRFAFADSPRVWLPQVCISLRMKPVFGTGCCNCSTLTPLSLTCSLWLSLLSLLPRCSRKFQTSLDTSPYRCISLNSASFSSLKCHLLTEAIICKL